MILLLIALIGLFSALVSCIVKLENYNRAARRRKRRRRMLHRQGIVRETSPCQCGVLESGNIPEPVSNEECDINQPIPLADKPPSYSVVVRAENTSSEFRRV